MLLPLFSSISNASPLNCHGERAQQGVRRRWWLLAAHWCSQQFCLDVFFPLCSFSSPVFSSCLLLPFSSISSLSLFSPLCLMLALCVFHSSSFSQSPSCVAPLAPLLLNLVPIHQTDCLPPFCSQFTLRLLLSIFILSLPSSPPSLSVSQMGICILRCRRCEVSPARSGERLAPRSSWSRRTFGCRVSRRTGVMQKPYRFRLMNMEMVGGKSSTIIPMGEN